MNIIQKVFIWYAIKILRFPFIDIKVKKEDSDEVEAMTFSYSDDYIKDIQKIE